MVCFRLSEIQEGAKFSSGIYRRLNFPVSHIGTDVIGFPLVTRMAYVFVDKVTTDANLLFFTPVLEFWSFIHNCLDNHA